MSISDFIFSLFTSNALPTERMRQVGRQLRTDREFTASMMASAVNYDANRAAADEMIGADQEAVAEDSAEQNVRNSGTAASNRAENSKTIPNMNNNQLTAEEAAIIQEIVEKFQASYDEALSLKANMARFATEQLPGLFPDEAARMADGICEGITTFNDNLSQALANDGFDYLAELGNAAPADASVRERYEMYVNFLAALQTLALSNMNADEMAQVESFDTLRGRLVVASDVEVTEDMVAEAQAQVAAMLNDNNFALSSLDAIRGLISAAPQGAEATKQSVTGSADDIRQKAVTALAAYVAYRNGRLESLEGEEITPEVMGVITAAGAEEARVIGELADGTTTVDRVIKVLKWIGGIAMFSVLCYYGVALALGASMALAVSLPAIIGGNIIGDIVAVIFSAYFGYKATGFVIDTAEKMTRATGQGIDLVIEVWRTVAWPGLKKAYNTTAQWLQQLFASRTVEAQADADAQATQTAMA